MRVREERQREVVRRLGRVRDDLRCEEHRRARGLGEVRLVHEDRVRVIAPDVALARGGEPLRVRERRDAEVADFDRPPIRGPEEVRRLDVAVDDPLIVHCMHVTGRWPVRCDSVYLEMEGLSALQRA